VSKRHCGSCRFFKDAGLAGSGWCHHPQRRTTSDLLIMVRKNELACRDQWARDLWEPEAGSEASQRGAPPAAVRSLGPVPPATAKEIAAVVQAGTLPPATPVGQSSLPTPVAEDVVLSEARVALPADPPPAWRWQAEEETASPAREADTKAAIKKAREAYRERNRKVAARSESDFNSAEPTASVLADGSLSSSLTERAGPDRAPDVDPSDSDVPAPSGAESDATVLERVDPGAEDSGQTSRAELAQPRSNESPAEPPETAGRAEPDSPWLASDLAGPRADHGPAATPHRLPPSEHARRRSWWRGRAPAEAFPINDGELPGGDSDPVFDESEMTAAGEIRLTAATEQGPPRHRRGGPTQIDDAITASAPAPEEDQRFEAAEPADLPPDDAIDALVATAEPAAWGFGLPRLCRTCRDFRPAEGGERGWCANQWAFTHRRMVAADDEVPCDSTVGDWWLPVDEVWTAGVDVSAHGQPTPLLDAFLPHLREEPLRERRRS